MSRARFGRYHLESLGAEVLLAALAVLVPGLIIWAERSAARTRAALKDAAKALGLVFRGATWAPKVQLKGSIDGFGVVVKCAVDHLLGDDSQGSMEILIDSSDRIPSSISFRSMGVVGELERLFATGQVRTGDPVFDREVHVRGDEAACLVALDRDTRTLISRLVRELYGVKVEAGRIVLSGSNRAAVTRNLARVVSSVLEVARRLVVDPERLDQALLASLRSESDQPTAERLFEAILARYPDSSTEKIAIAVALESKNPSLVWRAALRAGPASYPALVPVVRDLSISDEPPEVCAAVARALAQVGDEAAEPELIRLLSHSASKVRIAAIEALESIGTVAAVAALLEASRGVLVASEVRRAARSAIATIQARSASAERGSLALAEDRFEREGALSLRRKEGALSYSPTTRSRPS